jgi:tripartite-type tricarboxylate transporter receptor subunit TctC
MRDELRGITPELRERLSGMGLVPIDSPAVEQLQLYVTSEIERWGKVIRAAGIPESD